MRDSNATSMADSYLLSDWACLWYFTVLLPDKNTILISKSLAPDQNQGIKMAHNDLQSQQKLCGMPAL
jgi:hypothetical protein